MNRRKLIVIFAAVWLVLVGVLIGLGVTSGDSGEPSYGQEDLLVSVTGTGATATIRPADEPPDAGAAVAEDATAKPNTSGDEAGTTDKAGDSAAGDGSDGAKDASGSDSSSSSSGKNTADSGGDKPSGSDSGNAGNSSKSVTPATKTPKPTPEKQTFTFTIQCKRILDKQDLWRDGLEDVIPSSGVFFSGKLTYKKGESVYDALKRICKNHNILLDSKYTPLYDTYYVSGIGNLYEFDCGSESGWKYSVNGELPGVGCSKYTIHKDDRVVFFYDYEI
ncbi:MAG: DUF4430 domain-containing protein [Eubacterium sp.]|nr:DUF4430 domain-containing protein [Eubacterium sp.]